MLRPEQSTYPSTEYKFKESKQILEEGVSSGKFTFRSNLITNSIMLEDWLKTFGWKLVFVEGDFRESEPSYYKLEPANV